MVPLWAVSVVWILAVIGGWHLHAAYVVYRIEQFTRQHRDCPEDAPCRKPW